MQNIIEKKLNNKLSSFKSLVSYVALKVVKEIFDKQRQVRLQ